jgi:hypothetical protein
LPVPESIGHPSPRIGGNPDVTTGREIPISISKWIPTRVHAVRLPHGSVAGNVEVLSVIIQITHAVLIRRRCIIALLGVGAEILVPLVAPLIQAIGFNSLFQVVSVGIEQVQSEGLVFLYGDFLSGTWVL